MKLSQFARRWWMPMLGAVLGVVIGIVLVIITPKSYTATATLFVGSPVSGDASIAYNLDLFSQQRALTYAKLAQSRDIALAVQKDLGVPITLDELAAKVTAAPVLKTVLMRISATDGSPEFAALIANTFADDFTKYVSQLETPQGSNQPSTAVTVIQRAEAPTSSTSPDVLWNVLIGLFAGLAAGLVLKWLFPFFDHRIRTSQQVEAATGEPVLGVLPKDGARQSGRLNLAKDSTSAYAESLRRLRANLLYADVHPSPKTIAFIAPTSSISTTATAINLAVLLDGSGRRVGLVDADMRDSRVAGFVGRTKALNASAAVGGHHREANPESVDDLPAVLRGRAALEHALLRIGGTRIDLLTAASPSAAAGEMLASNAMAGLLADLRRRYDFVFCDTPGLLSVSDGADVGRACDGVVIVATQGKTRIDQLAETAETLRSLGVNVLGAVLTDVK